MRGFVKLGANSARAALAGSLAIRKNSEKEGLFVIEGRKAVLETLSDPEFSRSIEFIVLSEAAGAQLAEKIACESAGKCDKIYLADEKTFLRISETRTPEGVLAVCKTPRYELSVITAKAKPLFLLVLDSASDPGNLGTIIRLSDNFGVSAVLLTANSVYEYSGKVIRSTMGSFRNVPAIRIGPPEENAIETLAASEKCAVVASELDGELPVGGLGKAIGGSVTEAVVLVAGSESHGIVTPWVKKLIGGARRCYRSRIPSLGRNESLNLSVACAVYCYEISAALFPGTAGS